MKTDSRKLDEHAEELRGADADGQKAKQEREQLSDADLEKVSGGGSGGEDRVSLGIRSVRR